MASTRAKQILADAEREAEDLKRNRVLEGREEALKITTEAEKQANTENRESTEHRSKTEAARAAALTSSRARTSALATNLKTRVRTSKPSRLWWLPARPARRDAPPGARPPRAHLGLSSAEAKERSLSRAPQGRGQDRRGIIHQRHHGRRQADGQQRSSSASWCSPYSV